MPLLRLDGKAQLGPGGSPQGRTIERQNKGETHHEKGADIRPDADICADADGLRPAETMESAATPEPFEETPTAPAGTDTQPDEGTTPKQTPEAPAKPKVHSQ